MKTKVLTVIAAAIICLLSGCATSPSTPNEKRETTNEEISYYEEVKKYKEAAEQGDADAQYN